MRWNVRDFMEAATSVATGAIEGRMAGEQIRLDRDVQQWKLAQDALAREQQRQQLIADWGLKNIQNLPEKEQSQGVQDLLSGIGSTNHDYVGDPSQLRFLGAKRRPAYDFNPTLSSPSVFSGGAPGSAPTGAPPVSQPPTGTPPAGTTPPPAPTPSTATAPAAPAAGPTGTPVPLAGQAQAAAPNRNSFQAMGQDLHQGMLNAGGMPQPKPSAMQNEFQTGLKFPEHVPFSTPQPQPPAAAPSPAYQQNHQVAQSAVSAAQAPSPTMGPSGGGTNDAVKPPEGNTATPATVQGVGDNAASQQESFAEGAPGAAPGTAPGTAPGAETPAGYSPTFTFPQPFGQHPFHFQTYDRRQAEAVGRDVQKLFEDAHKLGNRDSPAVVNLEHAINTDPRLRGPFTSSEAVTAALEAVHQYSTDPAFKSFQQTTAEERVNVNTQLAQAKLEQYRREPLRQLLSVIYHAADLTPEATIAAMEAVHEAYDRAGIPTTLRSDDPIWIAASNRLKPTDFYRVLLERWHIDDQAAGQVTHTALMEKQIERLDQQIKNPTKTAANSPEAKAVQTSHNERFAAAAADLRAAQTALNQFEQKNSGTLDSLTKSYQSNPNTLGRAAEYHRLKYAVFTAAKKRDGIAKEGQFPTTSPATSAPAPAPTRPQGKPQPAGPPRPGAGTGTRPTPGAAGKPRTVSEGDVYQAGGPNDWRVVLPGGKQVPVDSKLAQIYRQLYLAHPNHPAQAWMDAKDIYAKSKRKPTAAAGAR